MDPKLTANLGLRINIIGEPFREDLTNTWGHVMNDELELIDAAIGQVCSHEQIKQIRDILHADKKPGVFL